MALKKITYHTEDKGVWSCPDCGWESEQVDFRRNPPPYHRCPKAQKRQDEPEPSFDDLDQS